MDATDTPNLIERLIADPMRNFDEAAAEIARLRERLAELEMQSRGNWIDAEQLARELETARAELAQVKHERDSMLEQLAAERAEVKRMTREQAGFMHLSDMRQCMVAAADENTKLRAEAEALRPVVDAAIVWAMCPPWGSYTDGPAVEDTCEKLALEVEEFIGKRVDVPPRWSVDEMHAAIDAAREAP
jgi:chromosome segregation ATPase